MKDHNIKVEGIIFNSKISKGVLPQIKSCDPVFRIVLLRIDCGVLLQIFNERYDKKIRKSIHVLVANIYSNLDDLVPTLFPYFNNECTSSSIVESKCQVEICIGQFKIKYPVKKSMELFCGDIFFEQKIFTLDRKYFAVESIGNCGLTFYVDDVEGEISVGDCKVRGFCGTRFCSYLQVCKPERFQCKKPMFGKRCSTSSSSSSSSSESSDSSSSDCEDKSGFDAAGFEIPEQSEGLSQLTNTKTTVLQSKTAPLVDKLINGQQIKNEQVDKNMRSSSSSSDDEAQIDNEEYFFINNPPTVRNVFGNPFLPNWKLTNNRDSVNGFMSKAQKKSQENNVSTSAQNANNTNAIVIKRRDELAGRANPFEPRNTLKS